MDSCKKTLKNYHNQSKLSYTRKKGGEVVLEVKEITAEDTYEIRRKTFPWNQTSDTYKYESDHFRESFHLGAFLDGELISIASFLKENNAAFAEMNQYRLHGMATIEEYRGRKYGRKLLDFGEKMLKKRRARLLWCYAKSPVSNYYTAFGLREHGEAFVIDLIGPHKVMYKLL